MDQESPRTHSGVYHNASLLTKCSWQGWRGQSSRMSENSVTVGAKLWTVGLSSVVSMWSGLEKAVLDRSSIGMYTLIVSMLYVFVQAAAGSIVFHVTWRRFSNYWSFVRGILWWIPLTRAYNAELWCFLCYGPEQIVTGGLRRLHTNVTSP